MIRTLRNSGLGQLFLGSIVLAMILAFAFSGSGAAPGISKPDADECAVQIGKACVSPKEYQAAFQLLASIGLNDSAAKRLGLREKIGRGLAEREVLLQEAERIGVATSAEDIDRELFEGRTRISLPADGAERLAMSLALCVDGPTGCAPGTVGLRAINVKLSGKFDFQLYQRTIRVVSGRSPNQFKEMQAREYTAEQVRNLVRSQVRVSADEAYLAYGRAQSKATARTVDIKSSWFERYQSAPTAEQLQAYKASHEKEIAEAEKAALDQWPVGCSIVSEIRIDSSAPSEPGGADKSQSELKARAEKLRVQAKTANGFDKAARVSSDSESAKLGGRLGCLDMSYGAGASVLMDAAANLKQPGDTSEVLESVRGFHLLQLNGRVTTENQKQLVQDFVTYRLASADLGGKSAEAYAQTLLSRAKVGGILSDLTDVLSKETLAAGAFQAESASALANGDAPKADISRAVTIEQDPISNAQSGESVAVKLFDLNKDGDVLAKPVRTQDGFAVIQLKSKDIVTRETFEKERVDIMASLQKRKAEQALAAYVEGLLKKAGEVTLNPKFIPKSEEKAKENDS